MKICQPSSNEETTEKPVSVSKWYCYFNLNRFVIFVLALFKLVLSVMLVFILMISVILCFMFGDPLSLYNIVLLSLPFFIYVIDMIIGLNAFISIYKKDQEIMEMYYMNSIYIFAPIDVLCCLAFYKFSQDHDALLILFSLVFLSLIMQMCLNHMMKKEVQMMRSNALFPIL